jgi:hypothetical protein
MNYIERSMAMISRVKNITYTLYYDIPYAGTFEAFGKAYEYEMSPAINIRNPRYFILYEGYVRGTFRLSDLWSDYFTLGKR